MPYQIITTKINSNQFKLYSEYQALIFNGLTEEQAILKQKESVNINLPTPKVEKKLQKAGRPKKEVNDLHENIYKEFLRLTLSNDKIIEKPLAVTRLTTSFGYKFKTKNIDSIKASINRIIREKANNN